MQRLDFQDDLLTKLAGGGLNKWALRRAHQSGQTSRDLGVAAFFPFSGEGFPLCAQPAKKGCPLFPMATAHLR